MTTSKKLSPTTTPAAKKKTPAKAVALPKKKKAVAAPPVIEDLKEELMVARVTELEEDNRHLKDVNRELRDDVAKRSRESGVIRTMAETLKNNPITSSYKPIKKTVKKTGKIEESAVLVLSDLHGDQIILPERVNGVENYNFDVFCKRMERVVDVTISHLTENMQNYNFKTLYVFCIGDMCSGEIHGATEHTKWKNAIKNAIGIGEVLGMALGELSEHFEKIKVVTTVGNHGRRVGPSGKKNYRTPHDNWDYLVTIQAQNKCRDLVESGDIEFITPEAYSALVDIDGHVYHLSHGDDLKSFGGIPFYGLERKSRRLIALGSVTGVTPNYFLCGHYHTSMNMQTPNGEFILNGSFMATDEYALESMGAYSEPYQLLWGNHAVYGKTWSLPIHLRTQNWREDEKKPSRYKVTIV